LKLAFAGTPDFAVPALELLAARHRIAAVFTQPDRPAGRGRALHVSAVKRRALALELPVHQPATFKTPEAFGVLQAAQVDALVVVAYGLILPAAVLDVPKWGCINIHASLLPRWRGAAPIQRALLAGDALTGITIMRMQAGLDTGPKLISRALAIDARDTARTLHDRLAPLGATLVEEALQELRAGSAREVPQPADGVSYAAKIDKAEAPIDWRCSAEEISRQVRAFNPWPMAETRLQGRQLRILEAEPIESPAPHGSALHGAALHGAALAPGSVLTAADEGIDVVCGSGVLRILKLQLAGRKPLASGQFLRGQRLHGIRFGGA
jgi:methionyl-tRNA formyltransferase